MARPNRPRLAFHNWPAAVYAIGDVHGQYEQLLALEAAIVADASDLEGEKWIVTVGDHIDRGPRSREVVDHVLDQPPAGFRRFALVGNHEQMLVDFLGDPEGYSYWLHEGGSETLASYGVDLETRYGLGNTADRFRSEIIANIPARHLQYYREGPIYLSLPGWLFVHAGIRPGIPLSAQDDEDMLWIREPFLSSQLTGGLRVVHGHTPSRDIVTTPHRIDIDTHCFMSGKLSAVRVTPDGKTKFFSVTGRPAR